MIFLGRCGRLICQGSQVRAHRAASLRPLGFGDPASGTEKVMAGDRRGSACSFFDFRSQQTGLDLVQLASTSTSTTAPSIPFHPSIIQQKITSDEQHDGPRCRILPPPPQGTFDAICVSRSSRTRGVGNKEMVLSSCFVHDEFKSSIRHDAASWSIWCVCFGDKVVPVMFQDDGCTGCWSFLVSSRRRLCTMQ
jgi:hypothetical protein